MKRTTLILEDGCMEAVRDLATQQGRTMSAVVNELLMDGVRQRRRQDAQHPPELPSFEMGQPRIDLGDRDALEAAMTE